MSTQMKNVLLINGTIEHTWVKQLQMVATKLGKFDVVQRSKLFEVVNWPFYDVIVINEAHVIGSYDFLRQVIQAFPQARVIIMSESADWRQAREAFQNGAADYIPTSISQENLYTVLQEI